MTIDHRPWAKQIRLKLYQLVNLPPPAHHSLQSLD